MAQTGAFAAGIRQEAGVWILVLTVAGPATHPPPVSIGGVTVRVEQGEAMSPLWSAG